MKILKSDQGFTLVEMLLVLVVIGILTSVSIPGLAGVRNQADSTAIQMEMSGIKNLLEIEYMNNDNLYPENQTEFEKLSIDNAERFEYESNNFRKDYLLKSKADSDGYYYETTGLNMGIIRQHDPDSVVTE